MSKDFSFLKNWLDHPNPRPVVLECVPSRSGLSLSVYDREVCLFRVNGCGFDRLGTALAIFLEKLFQSELGTVARKLRPVPNDKETTPHWMKWSRSREFSGFEWDKGFAVSLEGAIGIESMREIAEAIGLSVQVHETRSSTLLIIQRSR